MPFEERIDVHAHFVPDFYQKELKATLDGKVDGMNIPVRLFPLNNSSN